MRIAGGDNTTGAQGFKSLMVCIELRQGFVGNYNMIQKHYRKRGKSKECSLCMLKTRKDE